MSDGYNAKQRLSATMMVSEEDVEPEGVAATKNEAGKLYSATQQLSALAPLPYEVLIKILDAGPMVVALFSADCEPLYWNKRFEDVFGSLCGLNAEHMFEDDSVVARCVGKELVQLRGTQNTVVGECCVVCKLGTYEWYETRTQLLDTGCEEVFLYVATDITHQKAAQISLEQATDELEERVNERTTVLAQMNIALERQVEQTQKQQQALIESEERFRNIFFNHSGIRMLFDMDTLRIENANEGAAEFYGYSADELLGLTLYEVSGMNPTAIYDRVEEVKRSGQVSFTALQRESSGDMRYVEIHFVGQRDKGRRQVYAFVVDISERIEAERKVQEQQNHLTALMNSMHECAMLVAPSGKFITVNQSTVREFKRSEQELLECNLFELLHEEVIDTWREAFDSVLSLGAPAHAETDVRRCWSLAFYPVFTESLDVSAIAVYAKDITSEKRTSEHLRMLSKRVLSAQEDERKRIGRELHDSIAQTISGIKFMLEGEIARMERGGEVDTDRLGKMTELLQGAIVELRHIIMALRPTVLDDLGLISAIRWLVNEMSTIHPSLIFTTNFNVGDSNFNELQKIVLFRVAQEALANAVKHSNCENILLHLQQEDSTYVLYVQDDGEGFADPQSKTSGVGFGSMKERLELVSGHLDILSCTTRGTVVRAAVPVCVADESV